MIKKQRTYLGISIGLLVLFLVWTTLICVIDVQTIGPDGSAVGIATVNQFVHDLSGTHMMLYVITDWLGLVPFGIIFLFALVGLSQWIRRRKISLVDADLLLLGVFYILVLAAYLIFEVVIVNYRPILIDGKLEASYPSSTTMLVMCVIPTAIMFLQRRINTRIFNVLMVAVLSGFAVFMVIARLASGVHWFSDIIGGILLSAALNFSYRFGLSLIRK